MREKTYCQGKKRTCLSSHVRDTARSDVKMLERMITAHQNTADGRGAVGCGCWQNGPTEFDLAARSDVVRSEGH